jgi:hypothetical protein
MSDHGLRWEWSNGYVEAIAYCTAPDDAPCHQACATPDCEGFDHWDGEPGHDMRQVDYCNVVEWLNGDPGILPELNTKGTSAFVIAETPINPVWEGDFYEWELAPATAERGEG